MIKLIVAHDENRVIGFKNTIPWQNKEDLGLFKTLTKNNTVLMGRNTWESLPFKPLKDRVNIVISTKMEDPNKDNTYIVKSIQDALNHPKIKNDIYIIGGASIYKQAIDLEIPDEILISLIPGKHEGDTFFPELSKKWVQSNYKVYQTFEHFSYAWCGGGVNATY